MAKETAIRRATPADAMAIPEVYLASRKTLPPFAPLAHTETEIKQWIGTVLMPNGSVWVATIDSNIGG